MTIFISDMVGSERIGFGSPDLEPTPDRGRFSRLADLYRASFARSGRASVDVVRPEIYQTDIARSVMGVERGDWHLAIKPTPHLRPFHGLPNAFVFDGVTEGGDRPSGGPFADHFRVLGQADVIVCTTEASAAALKGSGCERVIVQPPCVPLPAFSPQRRAYLKEVGLVRVGTWVDGLSPAGLPDRVVEAFVAARTQHDGLRLVVGLPGDASREDISRALAERYGGQTAAAVSFTGTRKNGSMEEEWFEVADYVLSCEADEVFSDRLTQAMMVGIPRIPAIGRDTLSAAFAEAAHATPDERMMAGDETRARAQRLYGADAFRDGIANLERRLMERAR